MDSYINNKYRDTLQGSPIRGEKRTAYSSSAWQVYDRPQGPPQGNAAIPWPDRPAQGPIMIMHVIQSC